MSFNKHGKTWFISYFILFIILFQNLCRNCKRHYCNDCFSRELKFIPGENSRHCLTCRALQSPIAYRDHLIRLKVKDLQEYLRSKQISMNHCREKHDLVELILRHVEGGTNTAPSSTAAQPQQGRQPSQTNPSHPHAPDAIYTRLGQPRSSHSQPTQRTRPVQVCIIIYSQDITNNLKWHGTKCCFFPFFIQSNLLAWCSVLWQGVLIGQP